MIERDESAVIARFGLPPREAARDALAYVRECEAAGDFEGHDAPDGRLAGVLAAFRRYYGFDPGAG